MPAFRAVRRIATGKTMALHHAFKTAALRHANGVHEITGSEQRDPDDIAGFHIFGEITKFLDAFDRRTVLFFDMTEKRFGNALVFLVVETELHGVVAVLARLGLDLQHTVGTGQHDRNGRDDTLRIIHARVPEFFS